jgi:deoxyadenosine/deoxycytidine kinase
MGKLVCVVGNAGVGKTTLVRRLCAASAAAGRPLLPALEQHDARPFQQLFADDLVRYGLANQVDYLLLRGEQERAARAGTGVAIHDGGLDLDYHGFTQLFRQKGYLTEAEFGLCARLYASLRACLPPPDVLVYLAAPVDLVIARHQARNRTLEIARAADLAKLGALIDGWVATLPRAHVLQVDAGAPEFGTKAHVQKIAQEIVARCAPTQAPPSSPAPA